MHNARIAMEETKNCTKCKLPKPLSQFTPKRKGSDKLEPRCRTCRNQRHLERYAEERLKCLQVYSGSEVPFCLCCKEDHLEFLTIDHVEGGGAQERRTNSNTRVIYYWLKQQGYPLGYRVLCMNCNMAFGIYGYCPHKK